VALAGGDDDQTQIGFLSDRSSALIRSSGDGAGMRLFLAVCVGFHFFFPRA
jgi:hypothetical protein